MNYGLPMSEIMIVTNKSVAGAPAIGQPGFVDADFAEMLIAKGHAIDVTELAERVEMSPAERYSLMDEKDLRAELKDRKVTVPPDARKVDLVRRLLEDDTFPTRSVDSDTMAAMEHLEQEFASNTANPEFPSPTKNP